MEPEMIEFMASNPVLFPVLPDEYGDKVVAILTPPSRLHPVRRYKYLRNHERRIRLVMGQYAKELISAIQVSA